MPQFACVSLNSLAKTLRERYDIRNKMVFRSFQDQGLLAAENEIIQINKLITSHRRRCPHCKLLERRAWVAPRNLRSLSI